MKLSIIIVSYNVRFYLGQCIESVLKAKKNLDVDIWVVDNHSKDDSVEFIRSTFPEVHVIALPHNLGFAKANNIAIKYSQSEYVLLLNPDTIVGENSLSDIISFMDSHPQVGGCGVRMLNANGSDALESRRGLPTPMTAFYKMIGLCARFPKHPRFGHYYMGGLSWEKPGKIEIISGACFGIRREVLKKTGLLDEDFFMYGEDIDLSYRILKAGYENWYIPTKILHYKGESTQKSSFRYVHVFYGAMLIFFKKHYSGVSNIVSFPIKCAIAIKALLALSSMGVEKLKHNLGFRNNLTFNQQYLFIVDEKIKQDVSNIIFSNGLEAEFIEPTHFLSNSEHIKSLCSHLKDITTSLCIVYDNGLFSYEQILNLSNKIICCSRISNSTNIHIGIYHRTNNHIVTPSNIFK